MRPIPDLEIRGNPGNSGGQFRGHNTDIDKLGEMRHAPGMARLARLVVPGLPHHITQRGNRRQQTFFGNEDYAAYVELMSDWCSKEGVEIWGYCLMPNHVHLIAVPRTEDSLRRAIGEGYIDGTRDESISEKNGADICDRGGLLRSSWTNPISWRPRDTWN